MTTTARTQDRDRVLVTGAAGRLGTAIVRRLCSDGHRVRGFDRSAPSSPEAGVDYVVGDLGRPDDVEPAVSGTSVVIHAGATMAGSWDDHKNGTIAGTFSVTSACSKLNVRMVHISSLSILDWAGIAASGRPVDESSPLEPHPDKRGFYTQAKLEAENTVTEAVLDDGLRAVILRPGQIFGGGIPLINGAVARSAAGRWLVLGDGSLELPLVYIDDVVDAIVAAMSTKLPEGKIIHIVDPERLTQREVLELAGDSQPVLRVPRSLVFALGQLSELPLRLAGRQSPIAKYRLQSALARLHYDSRRAADLLHWHPRVGVREGIRRTSA